MPLNRFIFWSVIIISSTKSFTQTINKTELDSLFNFHNEHKKIMGSIAISKNGEILYTKAIGYSLYNVDEKIPSTEMTKYRIGSISKTFTSTIVFQLIEEGKISLATPLEKYFPKFPNAKSITIGNLLNHSSGLPNFTRIKSKETARSQDEMLKFISSRPAEFIPGTRTSYSNANYLLLGYIIEKVLDKPYEDVLKERIVSKIGLTDTYYGHETNIKNNESFPYKFKTTWEQQPETDLSIPGASGGILSTPKDLTKFIEALFAGKLISQNSLDIMKTFTDGYGMGMQEFRFHTKRAIGQVGGIDQFSSVVAYFPEDKVAIAFCSNGSVGPAKDLVVDALTIFFEQIYKSQDFKLIQKSDKPKGFFNYSGVYSNSLIPLKIIISMHNKKLSAQPLGDTSYKLEAIGPNKFKCDVKSVVIEFNPEKNEFTLLQGGMSLNFIKED